MKKMSYEEFIATQTENIEKAASLSVTVFYKNVNIAQFFGEFWGMGTHESGLIIELENDNSVNIPSNSEIEIYDEDESELNVDMTYNVKCNDLEICIEITF